MSNNTALNKVEQELQDLLIPLSVIQERIRQKLIPYSDGKILKGNELVGWLGEIYGKLFFDGHLVSDSEEHDIQTPNNWRVSVKARKGWNSGWKRSSAIPKIEGGDSPTHLLFVHLNDDYSVDRMWLFEWEYVLKGSRFKEHIVRGTHRSFIFNLDEQIDKEFVVYSKNTKDILQINHKPTTIPPFAQSPSARNPQNRSNTKERALEWLDTHHPMEMCNKLHASKFHPDQEIWFFTFPITYLDQNRVGFINILCESPTNNIEFYYLKVPYQYFRENQNKFAIRGTEAKFDLHISAERRNWMIDKRGENVNFRQFEVV